MNVPGPHYCLIQQHPREPWTIACTECSFVASCETLALAEREAISHFWRGRNAA